MKNKPLGTGKTLLISLAIVSAIFIIGGAIHTSIKDKTENAIVRIHATKLTIDDVMGKNLPPDPGVNADKTIAGIDANQNGIRDDVELAIFKAYPKSAKIRSALLQYALSMQLQMTLPTLNKETATATIEDTQSRAQNCTRTLSSREDIEKFTIDMDKYRGFVKNLQLNTDQRKKYLDEVWSYIEGFSFSNDGCDIDPNKLPN